MSGEVRTRTVYKVEFKFQQISKTMPSWRVKEPTRNDGIRSNTFTRRGMRIYLFI